MNPNNLIARHSGESRNPVWRNTPRSGQYCVVVPLAREIFNPLDSGLPPFGDKRRNDVLLSIDVSVSHDNVAVRPDREPVERSKGIFEWVQGRFGKLRTGFDKALLSEVEGLSPNGSR